MDIRKTQNGGSSLALDGCRPDRFCICHELQNHLLCAASQQAAELFVCREIKILKFLITVF